MTNRCNNIVYLTAVTMIPHGDAVGGGGGSGGEGGKSPGTCLDCFSNGAGVRMNCVRLPAPFAKLWQLFVLNSKDCGGGGGKEGEGGLDEGRGESVNVGGGL